MNKFLIGIWVLMVALPVGSMAQGAEPGQLTCISPEGVPKQLVPLKGTKVFADIGGMSARVTVIQTFHNTSRTPIEAIYTFPLPHDAAVDRMNMKIGSRMIQGEVHRREDALQIYNAAKQQGMIASLLDQERPNIFTQSVANIMPGAEIQIEISFVQLIKFEEGEFEWSFPMVVGPRYMAAGTPDPTKIAPVYTPSHVRTGTNISVEAVLDMGISVDIVRSELHRINVNRAAEGTRMHVQLAKSNEIPNRDFILKFNVKGAGVTSSLLTHKSAGDVGTFCLTFVPPTAESVSYVAPKELVIVMDQSGSQAGFPLEKSKEVSIRILNSLKPHDLFNVVAFSNGANSLWAESVNVNEQNIQRAIEWVKSLQANGGTEFLPAIQLALDKIPARGMPRIVAFNTDGMIGNDVQIIKEIQNRRDVIRMFTFGIGNGVNRFLIDAMAAESRGDSEIVTLESNADEAVDRFVRRIENPILTDIKVEFSGIQVHDLSPQLIPDVFTAKPVVLFGRYSRAGSGTVTISGIQAGKPWSQTLAVTLSNVGDSGSGLTTFWARMVVDDIARNARFSESRTPEVPYTEQIIRLALQHNLVTEHTSFVAVEKRIVNVGGKQRTVAVPVDRVDGLASLAYPDDFYRIAAPATRAQVSAGAAGGRFGGGGGTATATKQNFSDEELVARSTSKIHSELINGKGILEIQVRVANLDDAFIKKLKSLGLMIDDSDKDNKILFGRVDAKHLKKIAEEKDVLAIQPL